MKKNLLFGLLCAVGTMFSTGAMALDQKDGVYQISTPQDLVDFSAVVAGGEQAANAVITADLDMTEVADFTPIGSVTMPYKGTFDGQEHIISNLFINLTEQEYVGLFGVLNGGAYIKNLIMDYLCEINGKCFVGAFAGGTNGGGSVTFEKCGNAGMVGAQEQNAAGIIGVSMNGECSIKIIQCFNVGGVAGGRESAAFCGWVGNSGSEIINCYNAGWVSGVDGNNYLWRNNGKGTGNFDSYGAQGDAISDNPSDLESGTVAYKLNGNQSENVIWYQTLGVDAYPVPFASHGVVYAVGDLFCDGTSKGGETTFSNSNESNRDPHNFSNGVCTVCGEVDVDFLPISDGFYSINNADELAWFAALVNHGHKNVSARLNNDIDFTSYTQQDVMIGGDAFVANENEDKMAFEGGTFDGQGHTITINYNVSYDGVALFKVVRNTNIRNLVVKGAIESTERFIGGLGYVSRGTSTFENIIVDVNITGSYAGDATDGGFFAVCHENATFRNCAFIGSMIAPNSEGSAGIIGYAHGSVETKIENCYVAATDMQLTGNSTLIARHVNSRKNCFFTDNILLYDEDATMVAQDALASGELCYLIDKGGENDAWRQNLGQDAYPVPFSSHAMVYANGGEYCDGSLKPNVTYSNTQGQVVRDEHKYENDVCTVCGARIIRNINQLLALANDVNSGQLTAYTIVDLLTDLDMTGITDFEGIGIRFNEETGETNEEGNPIIRDVKRPFYGYFDGHGHKVSNMIIDVLDGNKGFIGFIQAGSTVKNLLVDNTCEIYSTGYSAGIVGASTGRGTLTIENCGNEAMVNVGADGANGAGILGVNDLSEADVRIINCYNTGDIVGQRECGGISGWLGDNFEVVNCYNAGMVAPEAVDGIRTFARYNGGDGDTRFVNCYEVAGSQVMAAEFEDLASGKLCYDLNQGAGTNVYYQTLTKDDHPVLDATHKIVAFKDGKYVNVDAGLKGDVNGDGSVDVADISSIISVMAGTATYTNADVNNDGTVDVADISSVISIMAGNS